jgi:hypothetical protein
MIFFCPNNAFKPTDLIFLVNNQWTTTIHWPCYGIVHVYIVVHFSNIEWFFWVVVNLFRYLFVIYVGDLIDQEDSWDPIKHFNPATFLCLYWDYSTFLCLYWDYPTLHLEKKKERNCYSPFHSYSTMNITYTPKWMKWNVCFIEDALRYNWNIVGSGIKHQNPIDDAAGHINKVITYLFIYKVSISYLIASVNLRMGTLALITIVLPKNAEIDHMYNCVNDEIWFFLHVKHFNKFTKPKNFQSYNIRPILNTECLRFGLNFST